jgi:hypothetical protein
MRSFGGPVLRLAELEIEQLVDEAGKLARHVRTRRMGTP